MFKNIYQKLILGLCIVPSSAALYAMAVLAEVRERHVRRSLDEGGSEKRRREAEAKAHAQDPVAGLNEQDAQVQVKLAWNDQLKVSVTTAALLQSAVLKAAHEDDKEVTEISIVFKDCTYEEFCEFCRLLELAAQHKQKEISELLNTLSPQAVFAIYRIAFYYQAEDIQKEAIKTLPDALVRLARVDGLQAVKKNLDGISFQDAARVEKELKALLMQDNQWMRYCCGEPEIEQLFNVPQYIQSQTGIQADLGFFSWKFDGLGGIALHNRHNIFFPHSNVRLQHPHALDFVKSIAFHRDGNKVVVSTGIPRFFGHQRQDALFLWRKEENWQRVEIDADRRVHRQNEQIISVHWVDDDSLVTISGADYVWTAHHWKYQNNTLVHEHDSVIPIDGVIPATVDMGYPRQVIWNPTNYSCLITWQMFERDPKRVRFAYTVYEYRDGAWQATVLNNPREILGNLWWDATGRTLYTVLENNSSFQKWTCNEQGNWQRSITKIACEQNGNPESVSTMSPDNTMLLIYAKNGSYSTVTCLKFYNGSWRPINTVSFYESNDSGNGMRPWPFIPLWNDQGDKLLIGCGGGDVRILNFNHFGKLSLKDFLLSVVCEKLKESTVGESILKREEQALREMSKTSPALKKALGVKPKWYSKEGVTLRAQKIQRWVKRNPKTALALCVAGGLLAYYAKKRLAPRVKKSIIMPLVARLKRKASK